MKPEGSLKIWRIRYKTQHGWETRFYTDQQEYQKAVKRHSGDHTLKISVSDVDWQDLNSKVIQLALELEST